MTGYEEEKEEDEDRSLFIVYRWKKEREKKERERKKGGRKIAHATTRASKQTLLAGSPRLPAPLPDDGHSRVASRERLSPSPDARNCYLFSLAGNSRRRPSFPRRVPVRPRLIAGSSQNGQDSAPDVLFATAWTSTARRLSLRNRLWLSVNAPLTSSLRSSAPESQVWHIDRIIFRACWSALK